MRDSTSNFSKVARFIFSGPGAEGGSLLDGRYRLRVYADRIIDAGGHRLDANRDGVPGGDVVARFFRLFGDSDGDADVDRIDLRELEHALYTPHGETGYLRHFDYNSDHVINAADFSQFSRRFGRTI